ncbi:transketolase C-terminal domain-containing protein [Nonomuraea wenchangensis]
MREPVRAERVSEHLNRALHDVLAADPAVHVLGEDIADPYGGAFKITKGLSSRFGERVRSTPISEAAIVGAGAGLALGGDKAIVEIMFADFAGLAFDQLVNFASKSTTMYGRPVPMPLVVRCPSGGRRGYGPTHSQSPQKHFLGVPGLSVLELTPFHDARALLEDAFAAGRPALLFEDKVLYTRRMFRDGVVDELFRYELVNGLARVAVEGVDGHDCTIIAPGGMAHRALEAMRELLLEHDVLCELLVPARLYPFDLGSVLPRGRHVCVAEDGAAGATWGAEVATRLYPVLWERLERPITLVSAADSVIPAAPHLEHQVLVHADTIRLAVLEALA